MNIMTPTAVAQLSADLIKAWNSHDPERVAALCSPDYEGLDVGEAVPQHGPEALRATVQRYIAAFPDLCFFESDSVYQHGRLVVSWTATGTHKGCLMNIPPTGRSILIRGITLLTIKDNKVAHAYYMWDVAGMLRSIGLLPEL
jgi:steroid delta-isomerase-like uncharacterized protein